MHFQENTIFDLDFGVKVTNNVAQYLMHHSDYVPSMFEVVTYSRLVEDAFTRKYITSTLYSL